jgi:hypothetical protein
MTANTYKKYYYYIITVYPVRGNSYPKVYMSDEHPLDEYIKFKKDALSLTRTQPYRVTLSFWAEISQELYDKYKDEDFE